MRDRTLPQTPTKISVMIYDHPISPDPEQAFLSSVIYFSNEVTSFTGVELGALIRASERHAPGGPTPTGQITGPADLAARVANAQPRYKSRAASEGRAPHDHDLALAEPRTSAEARLIAALGDPALYTVHPYRIWRPSAEEAITESYDPDPDPGWARG